MTVPSDATPLGRTATVVRNGRDVTDQRDPEARGLKRAEGALPARARTADEHRDRAHAVLDGTPRRFLRGELGREGCALARALESARSGARPRHDVTRDVGNRHDGVVERGLD